MSPASEKEPTEEIIEEEDRGGFSSGTMSLSWQEEMGSGAQMERILIDAAGSSVW